MKNKSSFDEGFVVLLFERFGAETEGLAWCFLFGAVDTTKLGIERSAIRIRRGSGFVAWRQLERSAEDAISVHVERFGGSGRADSDFAADSIIVNCPGRRSMSTGERNWSCRFPLAWLAVLRRARRLELRRRLTARRFVRRRSDNCGAARRVIRAAKLCVVTYADAGKPPSVSASPAFKA